MGEYFNLQPILVGQHIQVRPLRPDEFEKLYLVASDPLIWEQHPQKDRFKKEVFRQYFSSALESGGAVVVEDKAGGVIGASRFYDFVPHQSVMTIGYTFLSRAYWGGKFNQELKYLMLKHAFESVERVEFVIGADNQRSRHAISKIGAQFNRHETKGSSQSAIYDLTKAQFLSGLGRRYENS